MERSIVGEAYPADESEQKRYGAEAERQHARLQMGPQAFQDKYFEGRIDRSDLFALLSTMRVRLRERVHAIGPRLDRWSQFSASRRRPRSPRYRDWSP